MAINSVMLALANLMTDAQSVPSTSLDASLEKVVRIVTRNRNQAESNVLLSPVEFYDADTHRCLSLSQYLNNKLVTVFGKNGFHLVEPGKQYPSLWNIQARWRDKGEHLSFTFIATPWIADRRGTLNLISAVIPKKTIAPAMLRSNMPSHAQTLVHRLLKNDFSLQARYLHLRPVNIDGVIAGTGANAYFDHWLKKAIATSIRLIPLEAQREIATLPHPVLRKRGIQPHKNSGFSLTADLVEAQVELSGDVSVKGEEVAVNTEIKEGKGGQIAAASVSFSLSQLPAEVATTLIARPEGLTANANSYRGKLRVEIATSHGEGKVSYRRGDRIAFLVRVNRPAYVYLFDLDSAGGAELLYPALGVESRKLEPNKLLLLPDDGMPYELVVKPPFGTDLVLVVASEQALSIPAELQGEWGRSNFLRKRLSDLADKTKGYAEAEVLVSTGE